MSVAVENGMRTPAGEEQQKDKEEGRRRGLGGGLESWFPAPPCFFHRDCGGIAEIEKQGKAVCRVCAGGLEGIEYPLRVPSREPLYRKPKELVLQLEMKEQRRKRSGDG